MGSKVCFIAATNGYPFKKAVGGEGKDDEGSSEMDQPHWHLKIHFIKAKRTIEELRLNGTLSFFARVVAGGRGGRLNKELRLIGETIIIIELFKLGLKLVGIKSQLSPRASLGSIPQPVRIRGK